MRNEESWNTFTRTGRVSDYLAYTGENETGETRGENAVVEKRGQREGTCDGNGAVSGNRW